MHLSVRVICNCKSDFSYYIISSHLYLYCFKCFFLIQVREVGLPGLMDPALIPVGMGPEQALGTAPLLTFLIAVQEAAPSLKHAKNAIAAVSMLCLAFFQQFSWSCTLQG